MAAQAPPGVDLSENVQGRTIAIITVFITLTVVSVILRLAARRVQKQGMGIDDWLSILALVGTLGCFTLSCKMVQLGSGRHTAAVLAESPQNVVPYLQCLFAYELIYATTILFIKLSVLALYRRIFSIRSFQKYIYIVGSLVVAWWLAVVLVSIFSCNPVYGFWDKTMDPPAACISSKQFFVANAIPNIITDLIILALPMKLVWNLKVTMAQKISLTFLFLLGGLVTVSSIVRLIAQFRVDDPDFFWAMNDTVIWTSLEPDFGTMGACLPTLRPLVVRLFPKMFAYGNTTKGGRSERSQSYGLRSRGVDASNHSKWSRLGRSVPGTENDGFETLVDVDVDHQSKERRMAVQKTTTISTVFSDPHERQEPMVGHNRQF